MASQEVMGGVVAARRWGWVAVSVARLKWRPGRWWPGGRVAVTTTGIAVQAGARVRAGGGGRAGGLRGRVAVGGGGVNGRAGGSSVFWLNLTETVPRGWDSFVNFCRGLSAS
jgi:hypothetical protein